MKHPIDIMKRRRNRVSSKQRLLRLACGLVFCVSLFELGKYGLDYLHARNAEKALQAIYHAETPPVTETPLPTQAVTPEPTAYIPVSAYVPTVPPVTQIPTRVPVDCGYVNNPNLRVSDRFKPLQRENRDIIAWLSIPGFLDDPIVQRDNTYYLTHDYGGYRNDNGALFLDEVCDLSVRPMLYAIYGHNMKTGAMFGSMHKYEKEAFLHENPFVSFETVYESGRYVVFSVCNLHVDILSRGIYAGRVQEMLDAMVNQNQFSTTIDVNTSDQLLLLITCNGDDSERRIVAARLVREGESEDALSRLVSFMRHK